MTLAELHEAIQAALGWHGGHLHDFDIAGRQHGDPRILEDVADETRLTLNGLLRSGVARFTYTYDLGDKWQHQVLIERTQPALDAGSYPACVAGKRNCPPEDCGGPWGYAELLAAIAILPIPTTPTAAPGSVRVSTPTSSMSMPPMRT